MTSGPVRMQRALFALSAAFWLGAGVLAMAGVVDFGLDDTSGLAVLGVLMLGNGAALALAGGLALRGHQLIDYGALVLVALNAALSVTDEIGVLDVVSLLVNGVLGVLLVYNMRAVRPSA